MGPLSKGGLQSDICAVKYNRRMKFLFLFVDGVGLGDDDPKNNPLAEVAMPHLEALLGERRLLAKNMPLESERARVLSLDANLGVDGLPQSATGQASLLTGKNVPALAGEHYGPKPNKKVAAIIQEGNLFKTLSERGYRAALLNAYPERYFEAIESGKRLYSAIPLAVTSAGLALKTAEDLMAGEAFSVDFTGQAWRERLGYKEAPLMSSAEAGRKLAALSRSYDLAFFEFWVSDYVGHHQDHKRARGLLENFDEVLGGLLAAWEDEEGLILITSDHGNMEDLSTRRHTLNPVPGLVVGAKELRERFCEGLSDISQVTPAILQFYPKQS
jgi:2,3-bisphosphoglycerate-independent phosphoglycerate mutase